MSLEAVDSNLGRVSFLRETDFAVVPDPLDMQIARITSSSFSPQKETAVSNELRADRMVSDLAEVGFTSGGEMGFELSLGGTFDDFIEAALCGTYSTPLAFDGSIDTDISTPGAGLARITDNAAGTVFADAEVGQMILISDVVAPHDAFNGWWKVSAKEATGLYVDVEDPDTVFTDQTAVVAKASGSMLRNGVTKRSYSVEQFFSDANPSPQGVAMLFSGQRLGTMNISLESGSILTGTFGFQGTSTEVQDGEFANGAAPPTSTEVVNSTSNVFSITSDGQPFNCQVSSITVAVDNALRNQMAVGSKYPCGIGYGRQQVNGTMDVYFQDKTLLNQFLNHDDISIAFSLLDSLGNSIHFSLPRVKFGGGAPTLPGIDQDVMLSLEWQAIANDDVTHQIQVDVVNVTP